MLAVDPGRSKCGLAIVSSSGLLMHREIVETPLAASRCAELAEKHVPVAIVVGDGTGSSNIVRSLRDQSLGIPLQLIHERSSSENARARFLHENPPVGLARLVPRGLRSPDRAYDDVTATILAEKWWSENPRTEKTQPDSD